MSDQPADFIASFMDDYFAESEDHLTAARRSLLVLEGDVGRRDPSPAVVDDLFRSFHSLKGLSAMVELREAERLAHEMEGYLGSIRDGRSVLSAAGFDALVDSSTALEHVIAARRNGAPIPPVDAHVARLEAAYAPATPPVALAGDVAPAPLSVAGGSPTLWNVTFTPTPDLVARGIKVDTVRARLSAIGRIERVTPHISPTGGISFEFQVATSDDRSFASWTDDGIVAEPVQAASAAAEPSASSAPAHDPTAVSADASAAGPSNVVRVDLARLDDLMRLVGDLVVSRARLASAVARVEPQLPASEWRPLQEGAESIERQLRELREGVMRVRLVPVAEIFRRMPFVVRDLARDHGTRVRVELVGQGTEIDKFLIERMVDPVLHLVRNAISHGIESPEERAAAGKPPEATIRLAASTAGESVVLEVSDDGRGIDAAAIAARARAEGLTVPEGEIDARTLLDVICAPGFSTRDHADRASGRGVGMSVVRDTVVDLGGALTVETILGQGTTFRAVLPLTLAITDALIVHVGEKTFAVPQASVHEVADVEETALRRIEGHELMVHRGATLPVVRLGRLFAIRAAPRDRMHVIVVGSGPAAVGLLVDRISGQREVVVKTWRDPLVKVPGIAGATELGDGRLVLIVDAAALTRSIRARGAPLRAAI